MPTCPLNSFQFPVVSAFYAKVGISLFRMQSNHPLRLCLFEFRICLHLLRIFASLVLGHFVV